MASSSWGDDADQTHVRLMEVVAKIDEYLAACRRGRLRGKPPSEGPAGLPSARARGSLAGGSPTAAPATLTVAAWPRSSSPRSAARSAFPTASSCTTMTARTSLPPSPTSALPELTARGMATPEHLLRAGRLPVWLDLDLAAPRRATWSPRCGTASPRRAAEYEAYHARHAAPGERPLDDWAKVVLVARPRPRHRVHRQAQRRHRESLLPCHPRGHRGRRSGGSRSSSSPSATCSNSSTGRWSGERWRRRSPASARPRSCRGTSW